MSSRLIWKIPIFESEIPGESDGFLADALRTKGARRALEETDVC
jgi:hypothetical protein